MTYGYNNTLWPFANVGPGFGASIVTPSVYDENYTQYEKLLAFRNSIDALTDMMNSADDAQREFIATVNAKLLELENVTISDFITQINADFAAYSALFTKRQDDYETDISGQWSTVSADLESRTVAMETLITTFDQRITDLNTATDGVLANWVSVNGTATNTALHSVINTDIDTSISSGPIGAQLTVAEKHLLAYNGGTRIVALGDSLTSPDGGAPNGQGWVNHVAVKSDGKFQVINNAGIPGNTTAQILARVPSVLALNPQYITYMGGTNDITNLVPVETSKANVVSAWNLIRAAGVGMVILSIPPRSMPDKKLLETTRWNAWLQSFAEANRIPFINCYEVLVDRATGGYSAGLGNVDGLHFSRAGAAAVGNVMVDKFLPLLPDSKIFRPKHNIDPNNLISNGLLLDGPDASPTGWSFSGAINPPVNKIVVADAKFAGGRCWQITVDGTQTSDIVSTFYQNIPVGSWAVGDTLRFATRFSVESNNGITEDTSTTDGQKGASANALFFGAPSGATKPILRFQSLQGLTGIGWGDFVVPVGTTGPVQMAVSVGMSSGKSGVFRFGEISVMNLTAMGIV